METQGRGDFSFIFTVSFLAEFGENANAHAIWKAMKSILLPIKLLPIGFWQSRLQNTASVTFKYIFDFEY